MTPDEAREVLKLINEAGEQHEARRASSADDFCDFMERTMASIAQASIIGDAKSEKLLGLLLANPT